MAECIFCKIAFGEISSNKIYEDDKTFAFLDIAPVSKGHALVIPKQHAEKVYEMSNESAEALIKAVQKVGLALEKTFNCDFNVLNNNGELAGQEVRHVHFHIIPRTGEEEFRFNWPSKKYAGGEDRKILERIKGNL
ncbi:HIT domain-containing protein [Candidatus Woesearchaeota archaeon]|nr:HIT domain-containing protein [Candidatus Woesearchaeota archaeon]